MDKFNCHNCEKELFGEIPFCPHCGEKQPSPLSESDISRNPYKILQVSEDAEPEVIESAYKSLSKKYHPDIDSSHDAEEKMKDINWASDMLSDPLKRKQWDRVVKAKPKPEPVRPTPKQDYQSESPKRETKTAWRTPEDIEIKKPSHRKSGDPGKILAGVLIIVCVFVWWVNNLETNSGTSNIVSSPTDTPQVENGPTSSMATCTAQSQELADLAQPGDRITGATEDYAVTLIEYGDFQ